MKHRYIAFAILAFTFATSALGKTRYSGEFDYHDFQPSAAYFHGQTRAQIDHLCNTGEHASTEDLEECEHRNFERAVVALNRKVTALTAQIRKNDDTYAKPNDEPAALPSFLKAQAAWVQYRDNYCYSYVYDAGPGSAKYIYFFGCMASMTEARTKELEQFDK